MKIIGFFLAGAALFQSCSEDRVDRYWLRAENSLKQGQYQQAIEELTRVVNSSQDPKIASRAQRQIAIVYDEYQKDYQRAVIAYREIVKKTEDKGLRNEARWSIAKIYKEKLSSPVIAAEEYKVLFEELGPKSKDGPKILLEWAEAQSEAGQPQLAADLYNKFVQNYPGHPDTTRVYLLKGQALVGALKEKEAKEVFLRIISEFEKSEEKRGLVAEAYFGLGEANENLEQVPEAISYYEKSRRFYPNPEVVRIKIERLRSRIKKRSH